MYRKRKNGGLNGKMLSKGVFILTVFSCPFYDKGTQLIMLRLKEHSKLIFSSHTSSPVSIDRSVGYFTMKSSFHSHVSVPSGGQTSAYFWMMDLAFK